MTAPAGMARNLKRHLPVGLWPDRAGAHLPRMRGRGSLRGMNAFMDIDPKDLRPLLHAEIDKLRDDNVALLHRVALQLELEEVSSRLDEGFDADRAAGKLARLPEIIREARAALRQRST